MPEKTPTKASKAQSLAIVAGIIVVAALGAWYGQHKRPNQATSARATQSRSASESALGHSAADLHLGNGQYKLIDFGMGVCAQCKRMQPVMEQMADKLKGQAEVFSLDVRNPDSNRLGSQFKLRLIPLIVLVDGSGRELWRHVGYINAAELLAQTSKYFHKNKWQP